MTPYEELSALVDGRTLPMSIELFESHCLRVVQSIPLDDPLADLDTRELAANAVRLCREFIDYRKELIRQVDALRSELDAERANVARKAK
jgi:hypothetical protein